MEHGSPGVDSDPRNPLSRAIDRIFKDGSPTPGISMCLFGDLPTGKAGTISPRWLGAFVLSAGGRVIFFPGFKSSGIECYRGTSRQYCRTFDLDHISLEKGFDQWHFTTPEPRRHQRVGKTKPLGQGRFLWLGMSIADQNVLRELKAETVVTWQTPPSDSRRRFEVFRQAREGAEFLWLALHEEALVRLGRTFLHFAFIVGPVGFPDYEGHELNLPFGSPFLTDRLPNLEGLRLRSGRLSLGAKVEVQIVGALLPGGLRVPVAFCTS